MNKIKNTPIKLDTNINDGFWDELFNKDEFTKGDRNLNNDVFMPNKQSVIFDPTVTNEELEDLFSNSNYVDSNINLGMEHNNTLENDHEISFEQENKVLNNLFDKLNKMDKTNTHAYSNPRTVIQNSTFSIDEIARYAITNNLISNRDLLKIAEHLFRDKKLNVDVLAKVLYDAKVIDKREIANILYKANHFNDSEMIFHAIKKEHNISKSKVLKVDHSNLAIDFVERFYEMYHKNESFVDFELEFYNYFKAEVKNIILQLNNENAHIHDDIANKTIENEKLEKQIVKLNNSVKNYIKQNQCINESLSITTSKNEALTAELVDVYEENKRLKKLMSILETRLLNDNN